MSVSARFALADNIIDAMGSSRKIVMKDYYVSDKWVEIFKKHKNGMMEAIVDQAEEALEMMIDCDYSGLSSGDINVVEDLLWCIRTIGTDDVTFPFKEFEMNPFDEFHEEDFEDVLLLEENRGPHKVSFFCVDGPKQIKTHYMRGNTIIEVL